MTNSAVRSSTFIITCVLLSIGIAIAAFIYHSTTQMREALAEEILEQQHDVAELIQQYGNVLVSIERNRLGVGDTDQVPLKSAVDAALSQLDEMRSNYSFAQLDGAAEAHSYVKPIIEDVSQWTNEGIHNYAGDHPIVLEQASKRMRERFPYVRAISSQTNDVVTELISEQTDFLERFRDSLLWLLLGFVLLALSISSLLVRQKNLQAKLAEDQESRAKGIIEAETRGRLQAENAVVSSEQFLRATLNSLHADIAILDKHGTITAVNEPWRRFVSNNDKRYEDGGINLNYESVFESTATTDAETESIKEVIDRVGDVLQQKRDVLFHEYPRHQDDKRRWSLISMSTFYTDEGRHAVFAHEDVSDRKQLEERDLLLRSELAHTSRLTTAGELASGLAHELNQPLTAITHNCDAVVSSVSNNADIDQELIETVNDISEQAQRAGSIIKSMRHLVRKDTSDKVPTNVNDLVRETVRLTAPEAREKGVTVTLRLTNDLPEADMDPVQIQQVLVNLERNGVEAMWLANSPIKQLIIETSLNSKKQIQVHVTDTGPGVEPGFARNLFTAFQTTKAEGMGLGLSISRTIVENHGGRLCIDTEAEGVTIFSFTIPSEQR